MSFDRRAKLHREFHDVGNYSAHAINLRATHPQLPDCVCVQRELLAVAAYLNASTERCNVNCSKETAEKNVDCCVGDVHLHKNVHKIGSEHKLQERDASVMKQSMRLANRNG